MNGAPEPPPVPPNIYTDVPDADTSMVVLRVYAPSAVLRLDLDPAKTTLADFKQIVRQKAGLESDESIVITEGRDRRPLLADNALLSALGVYVNGQELWALTRPKASSSTTIPPESVPPPITKPILPAPVPGQPVKAASSSSSGKTKSKKKERKYKPFEEFLNDTDFNVAQLALVQNYAAVVKNSRGATKLPPTLTLKIQPYRTVDHVEAMNINELNGFVGYWKNQLGYVTQRAGYLFGYYTPDSHYGEGGTRAIIEAVYDPLQTTDGENLEMFEEADEGFTVAIDVAKLLGLEPIGWVFTHLPRDELITSKEILKMARLQLRWLHEGQHYTGYPVSSFITLTISPKKALNGEPGSDAFMVSDLGMAMVRDNLFSENPSNPRYMSIREAEPSELMASVLEVGKEVTQVDTDWLLIRVNESAPKEPNGIICRSSFPKINREEPALEDLKKFLNDPKYSTWPPWKRLADFHFLVYLASKLGIETAAQVCNAITKKTDVPSEFYELINTLSD